MQFTKKKIEAFEGSTLKIDFFLKSQNLIWGRSLKQSNIWFPKYFTEMSFEMDGNKFT